MKPLDYQEHDINKLVAAGGTGLVVSSVGGRKTLVAVETALRLKVKGVLVIAPLNTLPSWAETVMRQSGGKERVQRLGGTGKEARAALAEIQWGEMDGWYFCTPQWFARQEWNYVQPDMVIFDEVHTALSYTNTTRYKLHQLTAEKKIALSGTPLRNKWENVWALIRWLWPELMEENFWAWRKKQAGKWDKWSPQNWKVTGEPVPGTLVNSLPCYIQHLARENCCEFHPNGFLADLKEPMVVKRYVEMSGQQKRFYKQMEENYVAWLTTPDENGKLPVVAELPIVARGLLRTAALGLPSVDPVSGKLYFEENCVSPKLDELLTVLEEIDKQPALVYLHDKRFTKVTVKRLLKAGYRAVEWSGDINQKTRQQIKQDFIDGKIDVVVAVISAIGTGTDGIQLASNTEIWVSESEDGTDNEQGRGRLDRPGQNQQVLRIYIQSRDTMDLGIQSRQIDAALQMNKQLRRKQRA